MRFVYSEVFSINNIDYEFHFSILDDLGLAPLAERSTEHVDDGDVERGNVEHGNVERGNVERWNVCTTPCKVSHGNRKLYKVRLKLETLFQPNCSTLKQH